LASLVIALSLIPRLAAIKTGKPKKIKNISQDNKFTFGLEPLYSKIAPVVLKFRGLFLVIMLAVFILSMGLVLVVDKEFMPKVDQREFIMKVNMSSGTKLNITDNAVKKIEETLFNAQSVEGVTVNIGSSKKKDFASGLETMGSHQAQIIVTLKKGKDWPSTSSVIEKLKNNLEKLNLGGAEIEYVLQESVFKSALQGSAPIVIEIKGKDLDKITEISKRVEEGLADIKGIYGLRTSLTQPAPETKVNILKDRAALYNLSAAVIAQAAHTAIKGVVATKFKEAGREIDVRVRLRKEGRGSLSQVRNILVASPLDINVPLSEVAYITQGVGPSEIKRLDQQRVVLVTANIADRALDKVISDVDVLLKDIEKKQIERMNTKDAEKDITLALSGESQQMKESFDSLKFALILSILLVYMIMAAQFESLWQPFVIMFTVPLSLIGVLIALFVTHTPISVVVILGVIILGGIVVNNGIILIDAINSMRANGVGLKEAVIESGKARLRPILMTTMTTVLGLLPLALGISEGSELQSPMAITVMGGLVISTILTLFVVPSIYMIVAGIIQPGRVIKTAAVIESESPVLKADFKPDQEKTDTIPLAVPVKNEPKLLEKKSVTAKPLVVQKETQPSFSLPEPKILKPGLNKRQEGLMEYLRKSNKITRKEYAELFKISVPTAARDLKELLDKGIVVANGPLGPGRWYELKG
jgi:HAE1 family hydrophobic/amphiphilic exporter-1